MNKVKEEEEKERSGFSISRLAMERRLQLKMRRLSTAGRGLDH